MQEILDSLRSAGWSVLGHHDEVVDGRSTTYWKMEKGNHVIGAHGDTDAEALSRIRHKAGLTPVLGIDDAGPWTAGLDAAGKRAFLQSEDFSHDARLYVSGNFGGVDDELEYARALALRMNAMPSPMARTVGEPG